MKPVRRLAREIRRAREAGRSLRSHLLRRRVGIPIWADLGLRISAVLGLITVIVLVHWIDGGLRDSYNPDRPVSLPDIIYFTVVSITTTGFGDITPITPRARLIEAAIVTPIRLLVLYIFIGTAYTFFIKRSWEIWHMARIQKKLADHIVVIGFGVSGSNAVVELMERGTSAEDIVVVDRDRQSLQLAEKMGCAVIEGDASRDELLVALQIKRARAVLISAGRDDASILIVLTARHLAPGVPISVVVRAQDNEQLARQAGADNVINPVRFTGLLLAGSAQGQHISNYMADLASATGSVQLVERPVAPDEVGCSLDALHSGGRGLRVYRGGDAISFWEERASKLFPGDIIVEVVPKNEDSEADPFGS